MHAFAPPPVPLAAAPRYHLAAHYYTWYSKASHWSAGYTRTPRLGRYESGDPKVAEQHVDWAATYGIDSFSVVWVGPGSEAEKNLESGLLRAANLAKLRWFVFYDLGIRYGELGFGGAPHHFDLRDVRVRKTFVEDVAYLARRYFSHPRYLKVAGRPVLLIYLARNLRGDVGAVLSEVREEVRKLGTEVFIVGDSVWTWQRPERMRDGAFDALTAYQLYTARLFGEGARTPVKMAEHAFAYFRLWEDWTAGFGARHGARGPERIPLWPSVTPQYDDTRVRRDGPPVVQAASKAEVLAAFDRARVFADRPVACAGGLPRFVFVTSFNEWHEGTTVEPTFDPTPGTQRYPGGEYGLEFLEALREVFKPELAQAMP